MKQRVKLPPLGEGVRTATVLEWVHDIGDRVAAGEALLFVELEKIDAEIPSPVEGTLVERSVEEGDEVEVGTTICLVES